MKFLSLTLGLVLTTSLFANTIEEARQLYSLRGEDAANAARAGEIYQALAENTADVATKVTLRNRQADCQYYVGTKTDGDERKKEIFKAANELTEESLEMVEGLPEGPERDALAAQTLYWFGATLGKWGEANGPLSSLRKWPALKKAMHQILKLDQDATSNYGADRILGRAYHKLPKVYGGKKKALKHLQRAYDNTKNEAGISTHGLNTTYLAETLIALKKDDAAKAILGPFIAADPETLDPDRIPETYEDQDAAKELLAELNE